MIPANLPPPLTSNEKQSFLMMFVVGVFVGFVLGISIF